MQEKIEKIRSQNNDLDKKKEDIKQKNQVAKKKQDDIFAKIQEKRSAIKLLKEKRAAIAGPIGSSKAIDTQLSEIREKLPIKPEGKSTDEELARRNVEYFNKQQRLIEREIEMSTTLPQERDLINRLRALKQERSIVDEYQALCEQKLAIKKRYEEKASVLDGIRTEIEVLEKEAEVLSNQLEEAKKSSKTVYDQVKAVENEQNVNYKSIGQIRQQIAQIQVDMDKRREEFYKEQKTKRAQLIEEQKAARQKQDEERKRRREEWEREQALRVPFEDEILLCDHVDKYLIKLRTSAKKDGPVRHNLEDYAKFDLLSLRAPNQKADIAQSLVDVKAKKEHYLNLQKLAKEKKAAGIKDEPEPAPVEETPATPAEETVSTNVDAPAAVDGKKKQKKQKENKKEAQQAKSEKSNQAQSETPSQPAAATVATAATTEPAQPKKQPKKQKEAQQAPKAAVKEEQSSTELPGTKILLYYIALRSIV